MFYLAAQHWYTVDGTNSLIGFWSLYFYYSVFILSQGSLEACDKDQALCQLVHSFFLYWLFIVFCLPNFCFDASRKDDSQIFWESSGFPKFW